MIDVAKAKADAEEGLRIAEKAHPWPWTFHDDERGAWVTATHFPDGHPAHSSWDPCFIQVGPYSGPFIADSRTRAPEAYRNVIEMAGVIDNLNRRFGEAGELYGVALFNNERLTKERDEAIASYNRSIASREQDLAEFRALMARVTAAEAAEENMARKAEEHYDRAVKAEAERDALIAKLARPGALQ